MSAVHVHTYHTFISKRKGDGMADAEMQKESTFHHPASEFCRCDWTSGYMQEVLLKAHKRICNDEMIHEPDASWGY